MRKRTMLPSDLSSVPLSRIPHLLEVSHVAHRLSLSEDYVRDLIKAKQLPAIRFGVRYRVDPADLEAFIEARRVARDNGHGK
jgi:excisionase family DNA binding protein